MNRPVRVIYGFPVRPAFRDRLAEMAAEVDVAYGSLEAREDVEALDDPDVEVLFSDFVPSDLTRTPRLRFVQYSGAGVDDLASERPWARGIAFATASGVNALPIGEYVLGTLLRISQKVDLRIENQARRAWTIMHPPLRGRPLRGSTIVIVGYGSIGREVARLAAPFGMRIVAVKRDPEQRSDEGFYLPCSGDPDGLLPAAFHPLDDLTTVVGDADYVVLALPLTERTRHVVNADVLAAMRPTSWLINVGRGSLIDEASLQTALQANAIGGAAIDVATREPLSPDDPLWDTPRLIITPHVAGAAPDPWSSLEALFAANLRRYLDGKRPFNVVSADHGY